MGKTLVEIKSNPIVNDNIDFRDDLRKPQITFGRCGITGDFGPCIAVDVGEISVEAPDLERGIEKDLETGKYYPTAFKPITFETNFTVSKKGLELLLKALEENDGPVAAITPELIYQWDVLYSNGTRLRQFIINPETMIEEEIKSSEINFDNVIQIDITPRYIDSKLPIYTFVKETGKFYKNGEELNSQLGYLGEYIKDSKLVYARKVLITGYSNVPIGQLTRQFGAMSSVVQLLGWRQHGLEDEGAGCIIAIDERGEWRPSLYEYRKD